MGKAQILQGTKEDKASYLQLEEANGLENLMVHTRHIKVGHYLVSRCLSMLNWLIIFKKLT